MLGLCLDKSAGIYLALNLAVFVSLGVTDSKANQRAKAEHSHKCHVDAHYFTANTDSAVRMICVNDASDHFEPSRVVSQSSMMRSASCVLRPSTLYNAFSVVVILSPSVVGISATRRTIRLSDQTTRQF